VCVSGYRPRLRDRNQQSCGLQLKVGELGRVRGGTQRCLERKRLREAEKETQKQTRREKQRQRDTLGREENRERK
jgi:hypothetical protein